jgi:hypothetical protein
MNKTIIFCCFLLISATFSASAEHDIISQEEMPSEAKIEELTTSDTSVLVSIKKHDTIIDGHHVITDSILVEKIIEKTEPLLILYHNKEWSKLIIGILTLVFVVLSILWNKHKKKNQKTNQDE